MRLDIINGLRGWAILAVLIWHVPAFEVWGWHPTFDVWGVPFRPTAPVYHAWPAVNLFFFLSGFVLYLPYINGQRTMESAPDVGAFYKVRARRLLPLFAIFVMVQILILHKYEGSFFDIASSLTFTYPFIPGYFFTKLAVPLWSLAPEVYFSVAFPAILLAIRRFGFAPTMVAGCALALGTRVVGATLMAAGEEAWVPTTVALVGQALKTSGHFGGPMNNVVADSIFGRFDDFLFGMIAAKLYHEGWFARREVPGILLAVAGLAAWCVGPFVWDLHLIWKTGDGHVQVPHLVRPLLNYCFNVSPIPIVLGLAHAGRSIRWIWTAWPIQVLGMMCYSVYLWHWPAMFATTHRGGSQFLDPTTIATFLVFTLGLSALSYRYIEFGHVRDGWKLFRALPSLPPPVAGDEAVELAPEPTPSRPLPAAGRAEAPIAPRR